MFRRQQLLARFPDLDANEVASTLSLIVTDDGVLVLVAGRATAKKDERIFLGVFDLVNRPWRNGNGIPYPDRLPFLSKPHPTATLQDVVDFFGLGVVVSKGDASGRDSRFSQRLLLDARVSMGE